MSTVYRSTRSFRFVLPVIAIAGVIALIATAIIIRDRANALSATDFEAGNIISDNVFYDKNAMSVQQIQSFLNRLIPTCDTWRNETFVDGEGARVGPPFVCITNYHENPNTGETSFERGGGAFPGGISAAQIIYNAAQEYGINPQVLLVLLKKESLNLTGDTWPTKYQYKFAMGYACPDSGPNNSANCDPSKSGFYKQVVRAAWQFKYYKDHPNDYRYHIGWNDIQYSPTVSCGTKRVYIENLATLSLYIYTPYTPNNTALANYPGEASCGAYGNRNFFMFFSEWFGPTRDIVKDLRSLQSDSIASGQRMSPGDFITSTNGQYILIMQYSGVLSLYQWGTLIWQSSNSISFNGENSLALQGDGNLVIYDKNGAPQWATNTSGRQGNRLTLQGDGNLVLYSASGQPLWASGTSKPTNTNEAKGGILAHESVLRQDEYLRSSDWRYFLSMQPDGNLVMYTAGFSQAVWSSGTAGKGGKYIVMQGDGNLVMYGDRGAVWSSGTAGVRSVDYSTCRGKDTLSANESLSVGEQLCSSNGQYRFVEQDDGNAVSYSQSTIASWASGTTGRFIKSNMRLN